MLAEIGTKLSLWSASSSCARTPVIVQVPAAISAGASWLATRPCCQFNTTSETLLPGALKRTSKKVCGVRLEPEIVTEYDPPAAIFVWLNRKSVTTGTGPKVIAKTPPPNVPAYSRFGFCGSNAREETCVVVSPEFTAVQVAPASVLLNTPSLKPLQGIPHSM